ncbi:hypothetical protein BKA56DRAFT_620717 [Ilyonectria sp. MPI-CAGE-AT-0026]|nr:hypothetical protein BKA56DRAFT_620717 [Ilyonectria sp. MPI-CAGE-AT-0026]
MASTLLAGDVDNAVGSPLLNKGIGFTIVELLWPSNMRSVDDHGNDKLHDVFDLNDASTSRPSPFKVEFVPRSEQIKQLILQEATRSEKELEQYNIKGEITPEQF